MNSRLFTLLLVFVTVCAVAFAGCTGSATGEEESGPAETTTYIVGIDVPYAPFSMIDDKGNPIGFDCDSMKWIAADQGFEVEFQQVAWDGIIPALQAGKIDIIYSGMTITEERAEKVAFSDPYWTVNQAVVAREDSEVTIDDVLAGSAVVGTQRGCTAQIWMEDNLVSAGLMPEENLKLYDNTPLAITDLENGRIEAVMYDSTCINEMILGKAVKKIGYVETNEQFGIAVRQEDTELLAMINEGLNNLMEDPYWEELQETYGMK